MILTPHLLAGAVVASKISNPFLALPLAFLSHFLLDSLPHSAYLITNIKQGRWHESSFDFLKIFLDVFLGISLIYLFSNKNPLIFFAALTAIIPDGIALLEKILPQNKLIIQHQKAHMAANAIADTEVNKKIPKFWGNFVQIIISALAIYFLR